MSVSCSGCQEGAALDFAFSMAFQPIFDIETASVWGYEALIRGLAGEGAHEMLSNVRAEQKYRFDQACRVKAIELAAGLFPPAENWHLSINFMPNAVYEPAACLRATLVAARKHRFPRKSILFEFTEDEHVADPAHLRGIIAEYRRQGFLTAIDDFGAGYAGLSLLADFQPDLIKLDMKLIRGIEASRARQVIVAGVTDMARALGIRVLAEGVETAAEFQVLKDLRISLFQGYFFARPAFEAVPPVVLPIEPALVASAG